MGRYMLGAATAVLLAAAPVAARADSFTACDGYAAPGARDDGMLRMVVPVATVFAEPGGVAACTAALADPRIAALSDRRASLTRARAMHRLVAGDDAAALADLDAADAGTADHGDLLRSRSFGVGSELLRAYLALRRHDAARAIALADRAAQDRRYALGTVLAAARIRMQASGDVDRYIADLRGIAAFYPSVLVQLFAIYGDLRRWDDQIALRPRIASIRPSRIGGFQLNDAAERAARQANEELQLDAQTALALAMTGRDGDAAALLDRVDARLAAIGGPAPAGSDAAARERMVAATRPAATTAVQVRQLIAALPLARTGNIAGVSAAGRAGRLPQGPESLSLVELAVARSRAPDADLVRTLHDLQQRRRRAILERELPPAEVFAAMPEAESARRVPRYGPVRERSGWVVTPATSPDRYLINFGARLGTQAMVQDLVLLRAADLARSTGCHGFVVVTNRSFARSVNVNDIVAHHVEPAGYAAEAEVVLVDPAHPPADGADRVVDADRVYADLAPVYLRVGGR